MAGLNRRTTGISDDFDLPLPSELRKAKPKAGWKKQILKEVKKDGPPEMLIPDDIQNDFDEDEWHWKKRGQTPKIIDT